VEKTTVGYAARDLGISRQLVHVYIKKGLIRAQKVGPEKTAPYVLEVEDVQKLIGSDKLVAAHAQRMRLLGKPKKRKATAEVVPEAATDMAEAAGGLSGAAIDLGSAAGFYAVGIGGEPLDEAATLDGTAGVSEAAGTAGGAAEIVAGAAEGPLEGR
jgi:hypothetical protein